MIKQSSCESQKWLTIASNHANSIRKVIKCLIEILLTHSWALWFQNNPKLYETLCYRIYDWLDYILFLLDYEITALYNYWLSTQLTIIFAVLCKIIVLFYLFNHSILCNYHVFLLTFVVWRFDYHLSQANKVCKSQQLPIRPITTELCTGKRIAIAYQTVFMDNYLQVSCTRTVETFIRYRNS